MRAPPPPHLFFLLCKEKLILLRILADSVYLMERLHCSCGPCLDCSCGYWSTQMCACVYRACSSSMSVVFVFGGNIQLRVCAASAWADPRARVWAQAFFNSKFDTTLDILYSIVLVLVPLSYGIQTRFAVLAKQTEYRAHLNELLLLHSLSCNRGVRRPLPACKRVGETMWCLQM
jgi:hypothetical protein